MENIDQFQEASCPGHCRKKKISENMRGLSVTTWEKLAHVDDENNVDI